MAKIQIEVETPFEWCEGCRMFDMEEDAYETGNGERFVYRSCTNASICLNTYEQRARFYNSKDVREGNPNVTVIEGDKD